MLLAVASRTVIDQQARAEALYGVSCVPEIGCGVTSDFGELKLIRPCIINGI